MTTLQLRMAEPADLQTRPQPHTYGLGPESDTTRRHFITPPTRSPSWGTNASIAYDPTEQALTIRNKEDIQRGGCLAVDLPRWDNRVAIYIGKDPEGINGESGLKASVPRNAEQRKGKEYLATVNLNCLGINVKWQRLRGNIKTMYVVGNFRC